MNKKIEEEYIVDNAYESAMVLVNAGYAEISDDIRENVIEQRNLLDDEICRKFSNMSTCQ